MDKTTNTIKPIIEALAEHANRHFKLDGIFLFGSFARGDTRQDSDVDMIVLSKDFHDMNFMKRLELLSHIHGESAVLTSVPMDLIGYTPEEFKDIEKDSSIMSQAKKEGFFVWPESK